ncbi:hypothetical protein JTE90_014415 [Oedothorax gibbosus]|uniref:Uncharacterized protein n=1 Tax=Oedothorax gibbosus TaxID=931172 RepID=A0AAV6UGD1_9ARAC|nr:hypothetical protein JTE90_014415 [Oedothorax gibbosus]
MPRTRMGQERNIVKKPLMHGILNSIRTSAMEFSITDKYTGLESEKLLVEAAANGDLETVVALLQSGVSVDAEEHNRALFYASKNYMTPLQMGCANGHAECVEVLIAHNADVNAKDRFDVTALHVAAEKGNTSCLKALLNANAECSLPTKCSKKGCYTAVPYLGGTTPLHLAAENNHVDCIQELIQYGADYNAVDELGRTSLYIAAQRGFAGCVLAHLKNAVGRDILSLPSYETQDTPLHFAVRQGMVECVQALLDSGSDVNHTNFAGFSPLHLAVNPINENEAVCMEILQMLVLDGYNTDINLPDSADLTPLHYVCFNGRNTLRRRPEMAKFLIAYGANVNIKSNRGFNLLEYELKSCSGDFEVLRYVVRSILHPPPLPKLRVAPQLPMPLRDHYVETPQGGEMLGFVMSAVLHRAVMGQQGGLFDPPPHPTPRVMDHKHMCRKDFRNLGHITYCRLKFQNVFF